MVWYMVPYALCQILLLFVLFNTPKTSLVQVPVCLSLTDHRLVVHSCGTSRAKPMPYLLLFCACAPPYHILCLHYSRPLLSYLACLSLRYIIVARL